jgi:uncharacterized protein YecE (DUF72 family)
MPGRLYCGTSGWNYNHWRGILYPEDLPQSKWLQRYAEHFDTVEINNSFYRLPERKIFQAWHDQTPPGFTFALKASRFLTHMKKLRDPEEPLERMLGRTQALADKHGPILYHLPPYWHVNLERLERFLSLLPGHLRHVFEFRDGSWQTESVYDLLRRHGAGYCIMSAPDLPCHLITTADFAYIRMHNGGDRTHGRYTDRSLRSWAGHVRDFLATGDVYVYFNNDYMGFAVENARKLRQLVSGAG